MKKFRAHRAVTCALTLLLLAASAAAEPTLRLNAAYPNLPLMPDVTQEITVELSPADVGAGFEEKSFDLFLSAESGFGALRSGTRPSRTGGVAIRAGKPAVIQYRWLGPIPTEHAFSETIVASIPALSLSGRVEFSVGIDLRIADILLPAQIRSGHATGVEVVLHDAFAPSRDITPLITELGVKPELILSLQKESPAFAVSAHDAVAEKFFGLGRPWQLTTTDPGRAFTPGKLGKDIESRHIWRDADDELPTILPPSGGMYRLRATLRAPTGGPALREFHSPRFEVEQTPEISDDLPPLIASTIRILQAVDAPLAARADQDARKSLEAGETDDAITTLGACMRQIARDDALPTLGRYALALTAAETKTDEIAKFLHPFLRGYGGCGVLLAAKDGAGSWSAQARRTNYALAPQGAAYDDGRFLTLPFRLGDDFTLRISGGTRAAAWKAWKILPLGAERISVGHTAHIRTDRLSSARNGIY